MSENLYAVQNFLPGGSVGEPRDRVWICPQDMANTADAMRLGLPGSFMEAPETPGSVVVNQRTLGFDPPEPPAPGGTREGGRGIVANLWARIGGQFSVPQGPPSLMARVIAVRPTGGADAPPTFQNMPAVPTMPVYAPAYESYLADYR